MGSQRRFFLILSRRMHQEPWLNRGQKDITNNPLYHKDSCSNKETINKQRRCISDGANITLTRLIKGLVKETTSFGFLTLEKRFE